MLWVAVGGAVGAISRYLLGEWISQRIKAAIPVALIIVNGVGSLGLGLVISFYAPSVTLQSDPYYLLVSVGFFGAFTTFSTFSLEAVQLIKNKTYGRAILYIFLTLLGSILLFYLGFKLAGLF